MPDPDAVEIGKLIRKAKEAYEQAQEEADEDNDEEDEEEERALTASATILKRIIKLRKAFMVAETLDVIKLACRDADSAAAFQELGIYLITQADLLKELVEDWIAPEGGAHKAERHAKVVEQTEANAGKN